MIRALVVSALMLVTAAGAQDGSKLLTEDGLGNIQVGMKFDRLASALRGPLGYNPYDNHGCSTVTTKELEPLGISLQIETRVLTRVNVDYYGTDPRPLEIKTAAGIGLGSPEEDLLKAYPGAHIKPNPADPTWRTVTVDGADGSKAIVFETNGKTVKSMRAGTYRAITNPVGCN